MPPNFNFRLTNKREVLFELTNSNVGLWCDYDETRSNIGLKFFLGASFILYTSLTVFNTLTIFEQIHIIDNLYSININNNILRLAN